MKLLLQLTSYHDKKNFGRKKMACLKGGSVQTGGPCTNSTQERKTKKKVTSVRVRESGGVRPAKAEGRLASSGRENFMVREVKGKNGGKKMKTTKGSSEKHRGKKNGGVIEKKVERRGVVFWSIL